MAMKQKRKAMSSEHLEQAANCLRTLAHPVRLRLVEHLLHGRYTVGELADICKVRQNVASEHLRLMEHCGLLKRERDGRNIYYSVGHSCLGTLMDCVENKFG